MKVNAYDASQLPWPTDWVKIFGRPAPLVVEIGFGNAQFLINLAQKEPHCNVLGVEISLPSIKKAESKVKNLGLNNVQVIHGDARVTLWGAIVPEGVQRLYLNFPDPWHKAGHHHRKLINDQFLHLLATRMPAGGRLEIATDDPGYQTHIAECLERTPYFASRTGRTYHTEDLERIRTKYELKALAEGRVCHYFHWERNQTAAPNIFPIPQEHTMPHSILTSPLTLAEMSQKYQEQSYHEPMPIRFLRQYTAPNQETLLIETHIVEEPMPQRVALFIEARPDEQDYLIGLHELGFPRPTYGVHRAIAHLTRWVASLHEQTVIKHHNLQGGL